MRAKWVGLAIAFALVLPASAVGPVGTHSAFGLKRGGGLIATLGKGSWCWFGDPRAVRVIGRYDQTFVGWIDPVGSVNLGSYDNRSGATETAHVGNLWHDDHGSPSILVEPDKRLTVFYSGHNGTAMYYRTTLRPEDISAWGPIERVPGNVGGINGFTYPNPVLLPAEHNATWMFWRGGDYGAAYAVRSLSGRWSRARRLIADPGQRPYLKAGSNGTNLIGLAFTNGHPRELQTSIYYAAYRYGSLWTVSGRRIEPISRGPIAARQASVVYDGRKTRVSAWVWDIAIDAKDRPVIVYATFPSDRNHLYWYARWDGRRWQRHFLTAAGPSISPKSIEFEYSGGITLDHQDPSVVYLSRQVNGSFDIERWTTGNGGSSWHRHTVVSVPGVSNVRPIVPRGSSGGPLGVLWLRGHYGTYWNYRTSVAYQR